MAFRVQTVMLGPDTDQYAGEGQGTTDIAGIAAAARRAICTWRCSSTSSWTR